MLKVAVNVWSPWHLMKHKVLVSVLRDGSIRKIEGLVVFSSVRFLVRVGKP